MKCFTSGSSIKETNPTIHAQKVPTITDSRKRPLTEPEGEQSLKKKKRQKQKGQWTVPYPSGSMAVFFIQP